MPNYYEKYLKYKFKYLELKKQMGGVEQCDTKDSFVQSLYNVYSILLRNLKDRDSDIDGRKGRLVGSKSCNLWLWKHSHNNNYHGNRGDPVNHIDIYWDTKRDAIGVQVKKNSVHGNKYELEHIKYENDTQYADAITDNIETILKNEFP